MTAPDKQELWDRREKVTYDCGHCGCFALLTTEGCNRGTYTVQCPDCKMRGPIEPSRKKAEAAWKVIARAKPSGEVVPSIQFTTYTDGMGFRACIGDYDLDCHEGHGKTPLEAIQDLLNSHIDDLEE